MKRCKDCKHYAGIEIVLGIPTTFCWAVDECKLINDFLPDACCFYKRKWWKFWRPE